MRELRIVARSVLGVPPEARQLMANAVDGEGVKAYRCVHHPVVKGIV